MKAPPRFLMLMTLVPALVLAAEPSVVKSPPVAAAKPLSTLARSLLKQRMRSHGRDVTQLMNGVLMLDYETAAAAAQDISSAPRIAKEGSEEDALNRSIPVLFYTLQDQLRARAAAVNVAALAKDSKTLSVASGSLMATCVSCHAAFFTKDTAANAVENIHTH